MNLSILAQAAAEAPEAVKQITDLGIEGLGGTIGASVVVLGGAMGIGYIGGKAVEAIARQPEVGNRIFTTMVVAAALIEGFTFFALVLMLLAIIKK